MGKGKVIRIPKYDLMNVYGGVHVKSVPQHYRRVVSFVLGIRLAVLNRRYMDPQEIREAL
jgi:hypothetical protein